MLDMKLYWFGKYTTLFSNLHNLHDTSLTPLLVIEVPVLGEIWTHDTSLTPLLVIEVPVLGEIWTQDTSLTPLLVIEVPVLGEV